MKIVGRLCSLRATAELLRAEIEDHSGRIVAVMTRLRQRQQQQQQHEALGEEEEDELLQQDTDTAIPRHLRWS